MNNSSLAIRNQWQTTLAATLTVTTMLAFLYWVHFVHLMFFISFFAATLIHLLSGQAAQLKPRNGDSVKVTEIKQLSTIRWLGLFKALWLSTNVTAIFYVIIWLLLTWEILSDVGALMMYAWAFSGQYACLLAGLFVDNKYKRDSLQQLTLFCWFGCIVIVAYYVMN